jgi:hypothetical protein
MFSIVETFVRCTKSMFAVILGVSMVRIVQILLVTFLLSIWVYVHYSLLLLLHFVTP